MILIILLLQVPAVFPMQTYTGISRQNFGAEFVNNLKKEGRVRFSKAARFVHNDEIEDLFNVYDPTLLAFVWPRLRTGVHLDVGNACWDDYSVFFKDLQQGRDWAYRAVDASGRYNSGLLDGNNYWLGSKRECSRLEDIFQRNLGNDTFIDFRNSDYINHLRRKGSGEDWKYLMEHDELMQLILEAEKVPPFRLMYTTAKVFIHISKFTINKTFSITLGLCVPRSCTFEDIKHIVDFSVKINDNLKTNKTNTRSVKISNLKRIAETYNLKNDTGALILLLFTVFLVIIVLVATIVDLKLLSFCPMKSKSISFDLEQPPVDNKLNLDVRNIEYLPVNKKIDNKTLPTIHSCVKKCQSKSDAKPLTINNMCKSDTKPPLITLNAISVEERQGCKRCGKYKKQCVKETDALNSRKCCQRINANNYSNIDNVRKEEKESFVKCLLLCFSLNYSVKRIFNRNMASKDLLAIHVLKIGATFWIIFIHVGLVLYNVAANEDDNIISNSRIFTIGTFAFDTLFYVSGVLSAHHFFYLKSQYTTKELVSFGGTFGQFLQIICFVTNRAIRMLPSYMYVLFLAAFVSRKQKLTSVLELPEHDYDTCYMYWWRNWLYINNFYNKEEMCMQWSWYLTLDSQLHMVGVFWLCLTKRWRLALLVVATFLSATVTADVLSYINHYNDSLFNSYAVYEMSIERHWSRPAAYFVGLFTGWMVHRIDGQMKISKVSSICLWTSSVVIILFAFLRPWSARTLGATTDIVLSSLSHTLWALALTWPALVFACYRTDRTRDNFNGSIIAALSRLSHGIILTHGVVGRGLLLAADVPLPTDGYTLITYFVCTTVLSVIGSFLLSVLVETPCCSLLRRVTDCSNN